jgi:hypothetical protein
MASLRLGILFLSRVPASVGLLRAHDAGNGALDLMCVHPITVPSFTRPTIGAQDATLGRSE